MLEALQESGVAERDGFQGSTIYGRHERAEAAWAALANEVAAHGLEMDDVENRSSLHPGVVVFPAVLALAEQLASSPTDIYAAVVAGSMTYLHDGAWTKRLHLGWASHAGTIAARLAAAGFVGPTAILEKRASYNRHNRCKASIERL